MSEQERRILLKNLFLFDGVGTGALDFCLGHPGCTERDYAKGDVVFDPERFERALGVVAQGRIHVSKRRGGQSLPLRTVVQGEMFGAAALFGEDDYVTCLTAATDCRVLFLSQALVQELFARQSRAALNYIRFLSGRIRFLNGKIDSFTAGSAEGRLARYLLTLPEQEETVVLPCSLSELAKALDIGRASLYRAFDALERVGAIGKTGHCIVIRDRQRLREASHNERMDTQ